MNIEKVILRNVSRFYSIACRFVGTTAFLYLAALNLSGSAGAVYNVAMFWRKPVSTVPLSLASVTIGGTSPVTVAALNLTYGAVTGAYTEYCVQNGYFAIPSVLNCTWTTGALPATYTAPVEGYYTLYFWIRNGVETTSAVVSNTMGYDDCAVIPGSATTSVAITNPNPSGSARLFLSWTNAPGFVATACIKANSTAATPCTYVAITPTTLKYYDFASTGSVYVSYWLKDSTACANTSARKTTNTITVTLAAPTAGTLVLNGGVNQTNQKTVTMTQSGDTAWNDYCILRNDTTLANCVWITPTGGDIPPTYTFPDLVGPYTLSLWVRNPTGTSARVDSNTISFDTTPPVLASATITNTNPTSLSFSLTYGALSESITQYCVLANDTLQSNCIWVTSSTLPGVFPEGYNPVTAGNYTLSLWVKDAAGNTSTRVDTNTVYFNGQVGLVTKNISGSPGGSFTITYTNPAGGALTLKFRDRNTKQLYSSAVTTVTSTTGTVTLPVKAGLYETELADTTFSHSSYGQATVTATIASWTSIQQITPATSIGVIQQNIVLPRAVGDYSGDGYPDFAVAEGTNLSSASVNPGIYLYKWNTGTSQYALDTRLVSTQNVIYSLKFVDINADGTLDLVYIWYKATTYASGLCYMLNTAGTFGSPTCMNDSGGTATNQIQYWDFDLADLYHDGTLEVVVAGGISNGSSANALVRIFKWSGSGFTQFASLQDASVTGQSLAQVKIGDMNDDGALDIFVSKGWSLADSSLAVYLQNADGTFATGNKTSVSVAGGSFFATGYLNSDTKLDVVIMGQNANAGGYLESNASNNTYAVTAMTRPADGWASGPIVADLAKSGTPVVYMSPRNRLIWADSGTTGFGGVYYSTVAGLSNSAPTSANSIKCSKNIGLNNTYSNFEFFDANADGYMDLIYFNSFAPYYEILKSQ